MFRAIGRYFRALGYLLTGRVDSARRALSTNPDVVRATFDRVIEEKKKRIHQYRDAVGALIAQDEKKKAELKRQTGEVARLEKLRDGAAAMARKVVEKHGGNAEAVKADAEYLKCQAAFKDFTSTLSEKEARCFELEEDLKTITGTIGGHKVQLQSLLRELEKVKREKHETVADIITAKEEKEISDMLVGISQDRTTAELQELRDIREQAKATGRVSREMAGLDTKRSEEEFLDYASRNVAASEFDALIGLSQQTEGAATDEPPDKTRIPES
jgi:hypothetical protein